MLFDKVIFGPIRSRRLGVSLGVNLLPPTAKVCNFNCIYCECGWNTTDRKPPLNSRQEVASALRSKLTEMAAAGECPDVITFAGNGEPTIHPDFEAIIDDTLALRDELCPTARVSVLSNATMLHRESVRRALARVDNNILKLDSAFDSTARLMNGPQQPDYSVERVAERIASFDGQAIVQTMFLRGEVDGVPVDNTTPDEVDAWVAMVARIRPRQVMIYTIDRATPAPDLHKVTREELEAIAARIEALGIPCSVSA
ncbi:MAG: radical SAM protein [Rikenellaceae bacterium]|nr:radical SAM protein [Rikenellaceae bacterium]